MKRNREQEKLKRKTGPERDPETADKPDAENRTESGKKEGSGSKTGSGKKEGSEGNTESGKKEGSEDNTGSGRKEGSESKTESGKKEGSESSTGSGKKEESGGSTGSAGREENGENAPEEQEGTEESRFKAYFLMPVFVPAIISAFEILLLQQSITGAVRNFIVASVIGFALCYSCSRYIDSKMSIMLTVLAAAASLQAFLPGFIIPVASFGVVTALFAGDIFTGAFSLFLFSALPFLSNESSYEAFLFCTVTGMIGITLIYSRRETGKYKEALLVYSLVSIILYTGLIIMKRSVITPELILAPVAGLILNIVIMEVAGYYYYTNVFRPEKDKYLNVVDPEHPLLLRLKSTNNREYKRAIHTAHFTELFAEEFGYDRVLMKGLGFYHRIGVLREDEETPLTIRTLSLAMEEEFPDDIIEALKEYGEVRPGQKVSAELSVTIIVDTVINSLMNEFASGRKRPDLAKFIDKEILALFSGKNSLLKKSLIPYYDLEEIRKRLKGEGIYYDFLR